KVVVHRSLAHPRLARDVVEAGARVALARDDARGGGDDLRRADGGLLVAHRGRGRAHGPASAGETESTGWQARAIDPGTTLHTNPGSGQSDSESQSARQ